MAQVEPVKMHFIFTFLLNKPLLRFLLLPCLLRCLLRVF